ncbi:MAG: translocation/assembly module TamB [Calditerrivibrio sp.]|nr:translocation/assembly module TamB [Calditerrivibrio sp.]
MLNIEIDYANFELHDLYLKFYPLNYIKGKPYLTISSSKVKGNIPERFFYTWYDIDLRKMLKKVDVGNSDILINYKGVDLSLKSSLISYNLGEISIPYLSGMVVRDKLSEKFIGRTKMRLNPDSLTIEYFDIKGDDFFIELLHGERKLSMNSAIVKGYFGNRVLSIINNKFDGKVKFDGIIENYSINLKFHLNVRYKQRFPFDFYLKTVGDIRKELAFNTEGLKHDGLNIRCFGKYAVKDRKISADAVFDSYHIMKTDKWNISLNRFSLIYFLKGYGSFATILNSNENYNVKGEFLYEKDAEKIVFKSLKLSSDTTDLHGTGEYDFQNFNFTYVAKLNGNRDMEKGINVDYKGNVEGLLSFSNGKLEVKGRYKSNVRQKIYGIYTKELSGDYFVDNDSVDFTTFGILDNGSLEVTGEINTINGDEKYALKMKETPFYEIFNFFDSKSDISYPLDGYLYVNKKGGDYSGNGEFSIVNFKIKNNRGRISFFNSKLNIDSLEIDKIFLKTPFYFDFKKDLVRGNIRIDRVSYPDFPILDRIDLSISGKIDNPTIDGKFQLSYKDFLKFRSINVDGELENISLSHRSDDLIAAANIRKLRDLEIVFKLKGYSYDNISLSGDIYAISKDFKTFSGGSDKIEFFYNKKYVGAFEKIEFRNTGGDSRFKVSADIDSNYIKGATLKIDDISDKGVKGYIDFGNSRGVSGDFLTFKSISGIVNFSYDYHGYPLLYGTVNSIIDLKYSDMKLRLPDNRFTIGFKGSNFYLDLAGAGIKGKLDSRYYYKISDMTGSISFRDIFVANRGFYGAIGGELSFNGGDKLLTGDIFLINSVFRYEKFSKVSMQKGNNLKLPFDLDLKIYTKQPVKIIDSLIDAKSNISLKIKGGIDGVVVNGDINLVDGSFKIVDSRFYINKGFMKIYEDNNIFAYLEASGSGDMKNAKIIVQGYLPNYNITIYDKNLKGEGRYSSKNSGSEMLLSRLISDDIFKNIVSVSNSIFGINRIGIEPSVNGGVFKIGRKFSDRTEINYIADINYSDNNKVAAEYSLFDWLKIGIFSNSKGGAGAGFNFSIDY